MLSLTDAGLTGLDPGSIQIARDKHYQQWVHLVELFYRQTRYGCQNESCEARTCRSSQERIHKEKARPYRAPTRITATALATALASERVPYDHLCACQLKPADDGDGPFSGAAPGQALDDRSLIQQLFKTKAWQNSACAPRRDQTDVVKIYEFMQTSMASPDRPFETIVSSLEHRLFSGRSQTWSSDNVDACFEFVSSVLENEYDFSAPGAQTRLLVAAALLIVCLEPHPHEFPEANWTQWLSFSTAVGNGPLILTSSKAQPNSSKFYQYLHCALSRPALNCATKVFRLLHEQNSYSAFFSIVYPDAKTPREVTDINTLSPQYQDSLMEVLCVWAKLVFRDTWESQVIVQDSSNEHCALRFLGEIVHFNEHNVWPFYKESYSRMSLVGDRIDIVKDPQKWLDRHSAGPGVNLLRFKWLFSQRERVVFFRSMNFHRMLKSFEKAMEAHTLVVRMYNVYRATANSSVRRDEIASRLKTIISQCLTFQIRRDHILEDAMNHLWRRERRELLRPLKVKFTNEDVGEEGVDLGGLQQEFFRLAMGEALSPKIGLFTIDPNTQMTWFRALSPAPLYQFALIGMLFALAIYNGITLPVNFPPYFYKLMIGSTTPSLEDLKDGWPEVYSSLKTMKEYTGDDLEEVFSVNKTFTLDAIGHRFEIDMDIESHLPQQMDELSRGLGESNVAEHAAPVTKANCEKYVQTYIKWILHKSVAPQLSAFQRGFRSIFTAEDLDIISPEDFQKMVEGERQIDVAELRRVARYEDGFHANSQTIQNFWMIVETYSQDQLRALLEFVTATDRMPVSGMQDLVFVIMKSGDGGSNGTRLPSSHTCFNRLMLPDYPSKELLEDRLQVIIQNSEGFGIA